MMQDLQDLDESKEAAHFKRNLLRRHDQLQETKEESLLGKRKADDIDLFEPEEVFEPIGKVKLGEKFESMQEIFEMQ